MAIKALANLPPEKSVSIQGSLLHKAVTHNVVASIAQVLVDKHYRTMVGLAMLIEKDWVSLHYPFYGMLDNSSGVIDSSHCRIW